MSRREFGLACGILRMQKSSDRPLANAAVLLRTRYLVQYLDRDDPKTALAGGAEHSRAGCMANTLTLSKLAQTGHEPAGETLISEHTQYQQAEQRLETIKVSRAVQVRRQDWY